MSDVAFEVYSKVGISSPIAVNPPIWSKRWFFVSANIVKLVFALVAANVAAGAVNAWPDVALVPLSRGWLNVLSRGLTYHPLIGVVGAEPDEPRLIDDAKKLFHQSEADKYRVLHLPRWQRLVVERDLIGARRKGSLLGEVSSPIALVNYGVDGYPRILLTLSAQEGDTLTPD